MSSKNPSVKQVSSKSNDDKVFKIRGKRLGGEFRGCGRLEKTAYVTNTIPKQNYTPNFIRIRQCLNPGEERFRGYYYKLVKTFHQMPKTQVLMWPPQFFSRDKRFRGVVSDCAWGRGGGGTPPTRCSIKFKAESHIWSMTANPPPPPSAMTPFI